MQFQATGRKVGRVLAVPVVALGLGATAAYADPSYNSTPYVETEYVELAFTTVAGDFAAEGSGDGGPALDAALYEPVSVAVGEDGRLYVVDGDDARVRVVDADGTISTFAGGVMPDEILIKADLPEFGDGGPADEATLMYPMDIVFDAAGNAYISDMDMGRIRKVTPEGTISTYAGTDAFLVFAESDDAPVASIEVENGDGGPATEALLAAPAGMVMAPDGTLYFAELYSGTVRMITPDGIISTVAGIPGDIDFDNRRGLERAQAVADAVVPDADDDAVATETELAGPIGVDLDDEGNLYIAEQSGRISRVSSDGMISTVAGGLGEGPPIIAAEIERDTPAVGADIGSIFDVAVGSDGTVYFTSAFGYQMVMAVGLDGFLTTVAGTGESLELSELAAVESDPVLGPDVPLSFPFGLDIDRDDTLLVSELDAGQIHRVALADTTAPAIDFEAPESIDRFGKDNKISFACTDNRPGEVSCEGTVSSGGDLDTSSREGSVTMTSADGAGNETETVFGYEVNWELIEDFEDASGLEGTIARLYAAYFGRPPEPGGLEYWTELLESDPDALSAASNLFAASPEFDETYGSLTNAEFVELIYRNVMGREPEPGGYAFWLEQLDSGNHTRGEVMLFFSQSVEFKDLTGSS